jgi:hypothetical protein
MEYVLGVLFALFVIVVLVIFLRKSKGEELVSLLENFDLENNLPMLMMVEDEGFTKEMTHVLDEANDKYDDISKRSLFIIKALMHSATGTDLEYRNLISKENALTAIRILTQ